MNRSTDTIARCAICTSPLYAGCICPQCSMGDWVRLEPEDIEVLLWLRDDLKAKITASPTGLSGISRRAIALLDRFAARGGRE